MSELTRIADEARRKDVRGYSGQEDNKFWPVTGFKLYLDSDKMVLDVYNDTTEAVEKITLGGIKTMSSGLSYEVELSDFGTEGRVLIVAFERSQTAEKKGSYVDFYN